jgi:hypothetical protein
VSDVGATATASRGCYLHARAVRHREVDAVPGRVPGPVQRRHEVPFVVVGPVMVPLHSLMGSKEVGRCTENVVPGLIAHAVSAVAFLAPFAFIS